MPQCKCKGQKKLGGVCPLLPPLRGLCRLISYCQACGERTSPLAILLTPRTYLQAIIRNEEFQIHRYERSVRKQKIRIIISDNSLYLVDSDCSLLHLLNVDICTLMCYEIFIPLSTFCFSRLSVIAYTIVFRTTDTFFFLITCSWCSFWNSHSDLKLLFNKFNSSIKNGHTKACCLKLKVGQR